ncbi:MAG: DUF4058 family protein [Cyanobacteria bacterium P01_D01_bin.44]
MGLLDHFHPPLSHRRHWHSFHNAWATYIASELNQQLPANFFAEPNVQFGIEIDIAAFEESTSDASTGEVIPFPLNWVPPEPAQRIEIIPTSEIVEISIFNNEAGPTLLGAIELVSPANKDRQAHRDTFVSKCETYLKEGIGLVIIDVVTQRQYNLHNALLHRLGHDPGETLAPLYATAYRLVNHQDACYLSTWQEALEIGKTLPKMPLWLRGDLCLPVDFNATYERTCREQRISVNTA